MEYLQPIKLLEIKLNIYRKILYLISFLLIIFLTTFPALIQNGNPVLIQNADQVTLAKKEPWKFSIGRLEGFMKKVLSSRFEWDETNFSKKKSELNTLTNEKVFEKLKDSLSNFEVLNKSQNAKSFYVLEGYGFSNEQKKIEVRIIRVLKIQKLAIATPLIIQFEYKDVAITEANPYGLEISSLNESEIN